MSDVTRYALAPRADEEDRKLIETLVSIGTLVVIGEIGEYITNRDLQDLSIGDSPYTLFPADDRPGDSLYRDTDGNVAVMEGAPPGQYFIIPADR